MNNTDLEIMLKSKQGELDAVLMYHALADTVKDPEDQKVFRQLAAEEGHHAAVFKSITNRTLTPQKAKSVFLPLLYKVLGKKRLYPLIAQGEYAAVKTYRPIAERYPQVQSVKDDEKRHGDTVAALLKKEG